MVEAQEPKGPQWSDEQLANIATESRAGLQIIDRKYRFKTYKACFVGQDLAMLLKQKGVSLVG